MNTLQQVGEIVIDTSLLDYPKNYKLKLLDTIAFQQDRRYLEKNRTVLIHISNIVFNESHTKALAVAAASKSHLADFTSLLLFKK